jgi:hypothetical protein
MSTPTMINDEYDIVIAGGELYLTSYLPQAFANRMNVQL